MTPESEIKVFQTVYAVVGDCGLNGAWCGGVYTTEDAAKTAIEGYDDLGYTGWGGWSIEAVVLDAKIQA